MKFSIITWDASFREYFHTVDTFGNQNYNKNEFEFFWCDFYENKNKELISTIEKYDNCKLLNLNNPTNTQWHLGKTINHGIKKTKGDILIIPDGDIIVPENFLKNVEDTFKSSGNDLVCYFRRWDEPQESHCKKSYDINYLKKVCTLNNMTNYGGCFAIRREVFEEIGFCEEHEIFSGPGANGLEQYKRFRNKGLPIMWSKTPIYHPFHNFTGSSDKIDKDLMIASKYNKWIVPYMGLAQSWVLKERDQHIHWKANAGTIDEYLKRLKSITNYMPEKKGIKQIIKNIKAQLSF